MSASNGTNVECHVLIDENIVSGEGVDNDVRKSRRVVMKEEDLESDGGGGGFDALGDDDVEDVTPNVKHIKQEETKPQVVTAPFITKSDGRKNITISMSF